MIDTFPHRWHRIIFCLLAAIIFLFQPVSPAAQEKQVPEYHLKAVFLYNLVNFVSWPEERKKKERSFQICILGDNPFGPVLEQTIAGELWHGQPIDVEYHARVADFQNHRCDILFVSPKAVGQFFDILEILGNTPVLTVADSQGFTASGGMVNLMQEGRKVVIEINRRAAGKSGLFISSKLLRLARIVNE